MVQRIHGTALLSKDSFHLVQVYFPLKGWVVGEGLAAASAPGVLLHPAFPVHTNFVAAPVSALLTAASASSLGDVFASLLPDFSPC